MCYTKKSIFKIRTKKIYGVYMEIFNCHDKMNLSKTVIALGDFDGVHSGHKKLLDETIKIAKKLSCKAGIYTFSLNTKKYLGKGEFSLLTTDEEKNRIFSECGIDFVFYDDFSKIKDYSPEQFCDYIHEKFDTECVCCGENFSFGKGASAGSERLRILMKNHGCECIVVPIHMLDDRTVSSTEIRKLIACGDMEKARELLGYRYFIKTKVIHGAMLGRKLGFPTINQLEYSGKAVPCFGVYCCICTLDGKKYKGVVNVGIRPTVSQNTENPPVIFETHILDYSGDAYGKSVTVEFCKMLRKEKKFESLDELHENVMNNIEQTRIYFKDHIID